MAPVKEKKIVFKMLISAARIDLMMHIPYLSAGVCML